MGRLFLDMLEFVGKKSPQKLLLFVIFVIIVFFPLIYGRVIDNDIWWGVGMALFIIGLCVLLGAILGTISGKDDEHKNWLDKGKIK